MAQSLVNHQEAYLRARERPDLETGSVWAKKLLQKLWAFFFDIWKIRCEERHAHDTSHVSKQRTFRVHARTRAVYTALPDLPAALRNLHWFEPALDAQLELDTRKLEVWLAHTETLVQQGLAEMATFVAAGHHDIRHFFAPLNATNPPPPD